MRDSENENAVGNLLLHLEGNVRQWILSGIGGAPDARDRPGEFSAASGTTGPVLLKNLRAVVQDALNVIRTLPHPRLAEAVCTIQGYDTSVLTAMSMWSDVSGRTGGIRPSDQARDARGSGLIYQADLTERGGKQSRKPSGSIVEESGSGYRAGG